MRDLSPFELGWLVGFYEGEGHCAAVTGGRSVVVGFTQKDPQVLEHVRTVLGLQGGLTMVGKRRDCYVLRFSGGDARAIVALLKPHLTRRRQLQMQRVQDAWEARRLAARGTAMSPGQIRLIG